MTDSLCKSQVCQLIQPLNDTQIINHGKIIVFPEGIMFFYGVRKSLMTSKFIKIEFDSVA